MPNNWASSLWATSYLAQQQQELDRRTYENKKEVERTVDAWQPTILGQLETGYNNGRASYADASKLYDPYVQLGQKSLGLYSDSLGLNGATGNANATAAFKTSPGYEFRVNEATDGVARKASALGALGSGNTMTAISDRAGEVAGQEYGGWQDRLAGLGQMGYAATGAQAGFTKGIGDLSVDEGKARAGVLTNNLATKTNSIMGLESAANAGFQNMTNGTASAAFNSFKNEREDSIKNSEMLPNLLMGIGKTAASLGGKFLGGGFG